jgi:hypothetical protein
MANLDKLMKLGGADICFSAPAIFDGTINRCANPPVPSLETMRSLTLPRTAAAIVTQHAYLPALSRKSFESLKEERQQEAGRAVLYEVGESLSRQLRWTQSELRRPKR